MFPTNTMQNNVIMYHISSQHFPMNEIEKTTKKINRKLDPLLDNSKHKGWKVIITKEVRGAIHG